MQFTLGLAALTALLSSVSAIPFQMGTLEDCATAAEGLVYSTKANFDGFYCRSQTDNYDNNCNTIALENDAVSAVRNYNGFGYACTIYSGEFCLGDSLVVADGQSYPDLSQTNMNDRMGSFRCAGNNR